MGVEGLGSNRNIIPIETLRANRAKSREQTARTADSTSQAQESEAYDRDRLADELKSKLAELPDVRQDKVIEAKLRISSHYYDKEEVRREILRSVLQSLLPKKSSPEPDRPVEGGAPASASDPAE
jgi:hypothetical protein